MAGFLGAASIPFIGCVSLMVAIILQILSFASPYWVDDSIGDFGLWRRVVCVERHSGEDGEEGCWKYDHKWQVEDWLDIVRGLECLTVIFWSLPLVILPVYIYVALGLYYRRVMCTMTVLTVLGALTGGVGVFLVVWEVLDTDDYSMGWCIFTCAAGCGFGFIAFLVFLASAFKRPTFPTQRHFVSGFYADPDRNRLYVVETLDPVKDSIDSSSHANPVYH